MTGDRLAIRVGRSLQRFLTTVSDYTPVEAEVVAMHRAALAQLVRMVEDGNPLREPVVTGLEQVVAKRMGPRLSPLPARDGLPYQRRETCSGPP